jgi:serine/threonine-protein kinase ULK/ATG1
MHDGEAKIADFGFSKMIECEMEEALLKTYAGSPLYMSPQILKEQQYSSKCDVWSLGVIMYEILYGQPPWIAISIPDLIFKIDNQKFRFPERPIVSQQTQLLLTRMLTVQE